MNVDVKPEIYTHFGRQELIISVLICMLTGFPWYSLIATYSCDKYCYLEHGERG